MTEFKLKSAGGVLKRSFRSSVDPEDEKGIIDLLRTQAKSQNLPGASIMVNTKKGWYEHRDR